MSDSEECIRAGSADPTVLPSIPDMELLRRIGRGGFGEVWLARNQTTGGLRAVKMILLRNTTMVDAAGRELVSLSRLEQTFRFRDPNLVTIHHVGQTADHLFYIMDLADDMTGAPPSCSAQYTPATLASRLDTGPLNTDDCIRWSRQLLAALVSLHRGGLVHRDVKPSNCLLIAGELKLADFGLLTDADRTVSRVGTLAYMPPDCVMDVQADVYAAGLVIYEMVSGSPVSRFPAIGSRAAALVADCRLSTLNRLAIAACDPDRETRFRDASAMLNALEQQLTQVENGGGEGISSMLTAVAARLSRRGLLASCGGMALAAATAALWWQAARTPRVEVNFITHPFDATIWLDGQMLRDDDGRPYTTPCTVSGIPARRGHVIFKHPERSDLEIGHVDFAITRECVARWLDES
jgi:serine/threonine protein kinase